MGRKKQAGRDHGQTRAGEQSGEPAPTEDGGDRPPDRRIKARIERWADRLMGAGLYGQGRPLR